MNWQHTGGTKHDKETSDDQEQLERHRRTESAGMNEEGESLVVIPGLGRGELAVVESLLQAAGIEYASLPGDNECIGPRVLVRASEVSEVKELLAEIRIRTPMGNLVPIPW